MCTGFGPKLLGLFLDRFKYGFIFASISVREFGSYLGQICYGPGMVWDCFGLSILLVFEPRSGYFVISAQFGTGLISVWLL